MDEKIDFNPFQWIFEKLIKKMCISIGMNSFEIEFHKNIEKINKKALP